MVRWGWYPLVWTIIEHRHCLSPAAICRSGPTRIKGRRDTFGFWLWPFLIHLIERIGVVVSYVKNPGAIPYPQLPQWHYHRIMFITSNAGKPLRRQQILHALRSWPPALRSASLAKNLGLEPSDTLVTTAVSNFPSEVVCFFKFRQKYIDFWKFLESRLVPLSISAFPWSSWSSWWAARVSPVAQVDGKELKYSPLDPIEIPVP